MAQRMVGLCLAILGTALVSRALSSDEGPLFDGVSLRGWTTLEGRPITSGWQVVDGMIRLDPTQSRAGHIITTREFGDFSLSFEWKIALRGNSGLKYRVRDYSGSLYGCEYQIFDDVGSRKAISPRHSAGALYDLYAPRQDKVLVPTGEFNSSRIDVRGNKIEHWLNGRLIVEAIIGSDDWRSRVATSKFSDLKNFGQNRRGRIMLTDHGSEVWYRDFNLVPLPSKDLQHGSQPTNHIEHHGPLPPTPIR